MMMHFPMHLAVTLVLTSAVAMPAWAAHRSAPAQQEEQEEEESEALPMNSVDSQGALNGGLASAAFYCGTTGVTSLVMLAGAALGSVPSAFVGMATLALCSLCSPTCCYLSCPGVGLFVVPYTNGVIPVLGGLLGCLGAASAGPFAWLGTSTLGKRRVPVVPLMLATMLPGVVGNILGAVAGVLSFPLAMVLIVTSSYYWIAALFETSPKRADIATQRMVLTGGTAMAVAAAGVALAVTLGVGGTGGGLLGSILVPLFTGRARQGADELLDIDAVTVPPPRERKAPRNRRRPQLEEEEDEEEEVEE